jgi:hypothetical protein
MHRRLPLRAFAAALAACALAAHAEQRGLAATTVASAVAPAPAGAAPLREIGAGTLRWFGLHVYDARLFVQGDRYDPSRPFTLALRYGRDFAGERIAQTSIDEIRRLGFGTPAERERWLEAMRGLFPDVKRGDELAGVFQPGRGVQFVLNGRPIGEVADPAFAGAFAAIWLDPRTRAPELRAALLGPGGCTPAESTARC